MAKRGRPRKNPLPIEQNAEPETESVAAEKMAVPDAFEDGGNEDTGEPESLEEQYNFDEPEDPDAQPTEQDKGGEATEPEPSAETTEQDDSAGEEQPAGDDTKADKEDAGFDLDARLVNEARQVGFPDQLIGGFRSNQELRAHLNLLYAGAQAQEKASTADEQKVQPTSTEVGTEEGGEYEVGLSPDDVDEPVLSEFRKMTQHYESQLKELRGQLEQVTGTVSAQEQAQLRAQHNANIQAFEAGIQGLGDEYRDLVGNKPIAQMDRGSDEFENVQAIANEIDVLMAGCQAVGRPVPPMADLCKRAARSVLGDKIETIARKKIGKTLDTRKSQATARPTQRGGEAAVSPTKKAVEGVRKYLADRGIDYGPDAGPSDEDF